MEWRVVRVGELRVSELSILLGGPYRGAGWGFLFPVLLIPLFGASFSMLSIPLCKRQGEGGERDERAEGEHRSISAHPCQLS